MSGYDRTFGASVAAPVVIPVWQPNTFYAAGAPALDPNDGSLITAKAAFTSGATYSLANWNKPGNGTYGSAKQITGPTLPTLPSGTEYVWNKTDGNGALLDIISGVAP